jgi:hypothetical protein
MDSHSQDKMQTWIFTLRGQSVSRPHAYFRLKSELHANPEPLSVLYFDEYSYSTSSNLIQ